MNVVQDNGRNEENCNETEDSKIMFVTDEDFTKEFLVNFDLEKISKNLLNGLTAIQKFRHIYWSLFLGLLKGDDISFWISDTTLHRKNYQTCYEKNQIKTETLTKLDPQIFHPLAHSEHNPWILKQKNEELLEEIWKDIERTFPEMPFFTNYKIRKSLQRILFVWCKENSDVGYKQGMNELLAVIYLVFARSKLKNNVSISSSNSNSFCLFFCDERQIEADVYTFFNCLMETYMMKTMFFNSANSSAIKGGVGGFSIKMPLNTSPFAVSSEQNQSQSAVLFRCNNIFHKILKNVFPTVYEHLQSQHVEPQLFLLRWVRLLFSREYHIEDTLIIWDYIFADAFLLKSSSCMIDKTSDPKQLGIQTSQKLPLVDYFAISMIAFVRHYLLDSDCSGCLRRLLHFPPLESVFPLIEIALKARKSIAVNNSTRCYFAASNNKISSSTQISSAVISSSNASISKQTVDSTISTLNTSLSSKYSSNTIHSNDIPIVSIPSISMTHAPSSSFSSSSFTASAAKGENSSSGTPKFPLRQENRLSKHMEEPQDIQKTQLLFREIGIRLNEISKSLSNSVKSSDEVMLRKKVIESLRDISLLNKIIQDASESFSHIEEKKDLSLFEKSSTTSPTSAAFSKSLLQESIPTLLLCFSESSTENNPQSSVICHSKENRIAKNSNCISTDTSSSVCNNDKSKIV